MNVTWVTSCPTGNETGQYLTVDMGGTNIRVCQVTLTAEKGGYEITQSKFKLPGELKTGKADDLWGYIADRVADFLREHNLARPDGKLPLAFTFSYPVTQNHIRHGVLQRWTKGFDIAGVEGQDVVAQLETAFEERVSFHSSLMPADDSTESTESPGAYCRLGKRYNRDVDRLSVQRPRDQDWEYFRHRMQRSIYGKVWARAENCRAQSST